MLRFGQSTLQATATVCVALVAAFVVTAFASAGYHREKDRLGIQHYQAGIMLEKKGELDSALEEYRKALLFAPNNTDYRLSLAKALLEAGRFNEAQAHLEALLQDDPTSGPINLLVGRMAVRQHELKKAVEYYQRGVYQYWPESELSERREARWELASLLNESGDRSGFIGELMQLYTNLPPDATKQRLRVGKLLLANGAVSEASRIYQEQSRLFPQNPDARLGLGQVHFAMGEYVSARHEFQRVLRLDPKDAEASEMMTLTNNVIDLDPVLPNITASEQLRRSRSLLDSVVKRLSGCVSANTSAAQQLNDAAKLGDTSKSEDDALNLQAEAAKLWNNKEAFCGTSAPQDKAIDTVVTRIGYE